jgi:hypothetical protein
MGIKAYALTTTDRASAFMEMATPTGGQLTVLESLINSVTDFIETYCGRRFMKTTYSNELYSSERAESLNLKNFPISTTDPLTLEVRTSTANEDNWETVDSRYFHIDYEFGILYSAGGNKFARTIHGYRVSYTAGFDFDNSSKFLSDTDGGGDVELAAWMLINAVWNNKKGGGLVTSERIGDYSVTYKKALLDDPDIQAMLDKYAQLDIVGVVSPTQY